MKRIVIVGLCLVALGSAALIFWRSQHKPPLTTEILALESAQSAEGFAQADRVRELRFPADHGAHPDYQTEWWYYTGNLTAKDGRRYGYQLTFFRRGITPGEPAGRTSDWATNQIYFAHLALTDAQRQRHDESERYSRGAAGLAGAVAGPRAECPSPRGCATTRESNPFRVWIEDWSAEGLDADGSQVRLKADDGALALDLTLEATKPPVLHGDRGLSPKTHASGNASYYMSYTRMKTQGNIRVSGETIPVTGESWFDHEWGTTALGPNAVGWDWFSIKLADNREIMFYQIRNNDGTIEPVSAGTLVESDGTTRLLGNDDIALSVLDTWKSAASGGEYPNRWRLTSKVGDFDVTLTPLIKDQEMRISIIYWEGAVDVQGTSKGKLVTGQGYVELTGYAPLTRGDVGY